MNSDRRAIFSLLAQGRISPGEAERLIAVASLDRETAWGFAGCTALAAAALVPSLAPQIAHALQAALAGALPVLERAFSAIACFLGGVL
jgi:hypothetical protein